MTLLVATLPLRTRKHALSIAGVDPISVCTLCGEPSAELSLWREHDELGRPVPGREGLLFLGNDHPACNREMETHGLAYREETGAPGHLPRLCGGCRFRRGWSCTHPRLDAQRERPLRIRKGVQTMLGTPHQGLPRAVDCDGWEPRATLLLAREVGT